ncbi:MAG: glucose PTS transporter subunit IIA [Roseburia porci]|nr:glucose PTS transporter subunit IIA [Roseburia porci]
MDYRKSAQEVIRHIGGKENIVSAAHCATRLRLVIADNTKMDATAIENIDGVKGVFEASGQIQIIFGTGTVNKVYDEFIDIAGITGGTKEDVKQAAAAKQNIFKRAIKTLGDIFVPIIPAIVASGLLMGLLEGLCNVWPQMAESGTYTIIHLFSNAAFVYLPILIAISAAKAFGGNQFLGAVIGMIMIHSDLINAWSVSGMDKADIPTASAWFGLYDIKLVGYQGHVIPVVIAVWLMSVIEKKLHKIVPEIIDLFVTPLVTVLVTGYVTLTIIGPIFSTLENYVLTGAQHLIALPFGIGAAICGAFYAPTVVAGLHHMYNAIEIGLISQTGWNTWMPIATAANVAQGAAALAVAVKTKNNKTKSMALPASLSAFLGITEPAIFGVNVRFMKPFVAGCIGGAAGALVAGIFGIGATAYGITGIFGFLITTHYTVQYAIEMIVAAGIAFAISWTLYKDPEKAPKTKIKEPVSAEEFLAENTKEEPAQPDTVYSPLTGNAIALYNVNDPTFASGALGKGFAIVPSEGKVYAPFDGTLDLLYDTKHALGMTSNDGIELLVHVGLNTVELDGRYYTAHAKSGDAIKKGQLLLEFDLLKIQEAGYDITTPVIVTNADNYNETAVLKTGRIKAAEKAIVVK